MGYDVHIIRSAQDADDGISLEEWQGYIDCDPDLQRPPSSIPNHSGHLGLLRSFSSDPSRWPWLSWTSGSIHTKYPDRRTLLKMVDIATHFGAQVVGDEGEIYTSDADGRLFADGREWKAATIENAPSVSHESRWAALWVFELYPFTTRVDEELFSSLLLHHFQMTPETAVAFVDHLQNSCRVVLGTQSEATSVEFPSSIKKLGLSCKVTALDYGSSERYPRWLAPAGYFKPQPWNLKVSGYRGSSDLDSTQQLLSEHLGITRGDANELMEKLRHGAPTTFTFDDLEGACNAAEPLQRHGFTIEIK